MTSSDLLERSSQLDELNRRFALASGGHGQTMLVSGEAGSGKTSLVSAFLDGLPATVVIRSVSCDAAGIHGPLGPVLDIADTFGSQVSAAVEEDLAVERVARSILNELRAADAPNVLVAEDVHWADQATLDLIRFLARRLEGTRTLLIATFRDDSLEPDHELRRLIGDLTGQPNTRSLALPPLSYAAVEQLATGAGLDPEAVFTSTGGNPFFVSEIVNAHGDTLPRSIRDVVLARMARLDPESRAVLELAAVTGPTIDHRFLRRVWDSDPAVELERCIHVGLLRSGTQEGITFRHALTRDVILAEMSSLRRSAHAERVLRALEMDSRANTNAALLAHFAEEAVNAEAVGRYAPEAAREAARVGAHRQSVLQYDRALRFADGQNEGQIAALLEARSFELYVTSQTPQALEDISKAIEIRQRLQDLQQLGDDLRLRSRYQWISGRNALAERDARAALDALEQGPPSIELVMAYSNLSQLLMLSRDSPGAIAWGNRAIDLATLLEAPHVVVHAKTNVGTTMIVRDEPGWELLEDAERIAAQLGLHDDVARTFTNRAFSALEHDNLPLTIELARKGISYTDEHDVLALGWYLRVLMLAAEIEGGNLETPESELVGFDRNPRLTVPTRIVALTWLGTLRARTGASAAPLLDEALSLAEGTGEIQRIGPVRAARAEAAWLSGDLQQTRREAVAAFHPDFPVEHRWINARLGLWLARSGERVDQLNGFPNHYQLELDGCFLDAAELWHRLGFPIQSARARAAEGSVEQLRASLEQFQAVNARPDAARVTRLLRERGETGIPKGPRARTRGHVAGLTEREAEIVRMLAQGQSNREIAEKLFISPRTCGHHVSAILSKLGIATRREVAARAQELGLI